eukprot:4354343-Pyramimonas_sp.AAC.1
MRGRSCGSACWTSACGRSAGSRGRPPPPQAPRSRQRPRLPPPPQCGGARGGHAPHSRSRRPPTTKRSGRRRRVRPYARNSWSLGSLRSLNTASKSRPYGQHPENPRSDGMGRGPIGAAGLQ